MLKDKWLLRKYSKLADKVLKIDDYKHFTTQMEFMSETEKFKARLKQGEKLDDILPQAFALVRQAAKLVLGLEPYKVQVIGGIALHYGNIAEMRTGEGKTLTATMPVYLNALSGEGVHVVTVNEYLAERDSTEMGELYNFLGLTVGLNKAELPQNEKWEAFQCDITYTTNSELGFDYLRDNMRLTAEGKVLRKLHYCVIDEIDSVLIDDARTPLIIAGKSSQSTMEYFKVNEFVKTLHFNDVVYDHQSKSVHLTPQGVDRAEAHFRVDNLYGLENVSLIHLIDQSLYAHFAMKKDVDYIVRDGAIAIVDTSTGRVMDGRQFSDGLHQALESKEGVDVNDETKTFASISYQNFFRMYEKLSGMTGTASTERKEFMSTYKMRVITIPTNRPIRRIDEDDVIFATMKAKYKAVVDEIERVHETGQPILVGTSSVENSELLSEMLTKRKIQHQVLNAKQDENEAHIVARAGERYAVTVATNMAGRGTDIKLGHKVKELGGLYVLGTEKHENRRIDNQLRGRSGRQGDVGRSVFMISLEDDLMKRYGGDKIEAKAKKLTHVTEPITTHGLRRAVTNAQKRIEGNGFDTRKSLLEYDDVAQLHRLSIYELRENALCGHMNMDDYYHDAIVTTVDDLLAPYFENEIVNMDSVADAVTQLTHKKLWLNEIMSVESQLELKQVVLDFVLQAYHEKVGKAVLNRTTDEQRRALVSSIDKAWVTHLTQLDQLKDAVELRSYSQVQPVTEYQLEAKKLFNDLKREIEISAVRKLFATVL